MWRLHGLQPRLGQRPFVVGGAARRGLLRHAATLARWFGMADTELAGVLPGLRNFGGPAYPVNLGFLG